MGRVADAARSLVRFAHYVKHNKGTELPHAAVWLDTETDPRPAGINQVTQHLRFGWACYSRSRSGHKWTKPVWKRFTTAAQCWTWVESLLRSKQRLYVFAHNWNFDAPVLDMFNILPARGWSLYKAVIEKPPVILHWRRGNQTIVCLDTMNWWRMSAATIGDSLKLPKLKMPEPTAPKREWDTYCKRDVEVIHRAMSEWWEFLRTFDLGSFGPTLASQAIRAFRHRFMTHEILIDNNPDALKLARSSLHGGRVECFRIGHEIGPIDVFDVNSMYPFVMRDNLFPARLRCFTTRTTVSDLKQWVTDYCCVALVDIQTTRPRFAHVVDNRLVFPVGRFTEPLTTPDLKDALKHGEVARVRALAVYDAEPLFNSFVTELYALRKKATDAGQGVQSWLLKILLNSLYGKFAQRGNVWETERKADDTQVKTWFEVDADTREITSYRQFGGVVQRKHRETESLDSHPAIASHVTAYARAYLWDLMERFNRSSVLYCDTDSLFVRNMQRTGQLPSIGSSALGSLKHEATLAWVNLYGPKDYQTPDKQVIKGIRASAVPTGNGTFRQEQWSSITGLIRAEDLTAPRIKQVSKVLARNYTKGTVLRDGTVQPLLLSEWV